MKAPDKIYVREYPDGIARFWEEKKKEDVVATIPHEYIRKDALMEWAEGRKKHYMDRQEYDCGWNDLLDELIDKLNSM